VGKLYRYSKDKNALQARLKRIEGQVRGIQRMIDEDRYCVEILQQFAALSAAVDQAALLLLEDHVRGCVADAVREQREEHYINELMEIIKKVTRR